MKRKAFLVILIASILFLPSCDNEPLPKPIGYFRIDLPKKEYRKIDSIPFPFSFQLPQYAFVNLERTKKERHFLNIDFPRYGARIHLSYLPVDTNLNRYLEDSRSLVYKHVIKAQDIGENTIINEEGRVFGTYYQIEGNAASGSQFYLTDSTHHFLRGALYFNVAPNPDSLAPVLKFIKQDIENLIENFRWSKNQSDSISHN